MLRRGAARHDGPAVGRRARVEARHVAAHALARQDEPVGAEQQAVERAAPPARRGVEAVPGRDEPHAGRGGKELVSESGASDGASMRNSQVAISRNYCLGMCN